MPKDEELNNFWFSNCIAGAWANIGLPYFYLLHEKNGCLKGFSQNMLRQTKKKKKGGSEEFQFAY